MRKLFLTMAVLIATQALFAQNAEVVSAFNAYRDEMPDKAKAHIDKAITDPKTAGEAKTWYYRGNIYLQIDIAAHYTDALKKGMTGDEVKKVLGEPLTQRRYRKLENGEKWTYNFELIVYFSNGKVVSWEYPNAALYKSLDDGKTLETAYEAYQKSLEIDPKYVNIQLSPMNAMMGIQKVADAYFNKGYNDYLNKNYKSSQYNLEHALRTYKQVGKEDPQLVYYTGVACLAAGDTASALNYYNKAVKMGYKDKLLYYNMVNIYLAQNKIKEAKEIIKKGREYHPDDQDLLITEANIYLKAGESREAEKILLKAIERDPKNAQLYYVVGANYDNIINDSTSTQEIKDNAFEQAQKAYKKAIELDPNYFDANFNMGVLLNNKAAAIMTYVSNLPIDKEKEYQEGKAKALEFLKQAKPYLEKAHELQPKDHDTMILLKQIYMKTNNTEMFKKISEELKKN